MTLSDSENWQAVQVGTSTKNKLTSKNTLLNKNLLNYNNFYSNPSTENPCSNKVARLEIFATTVQKVCTSKPTSDHTTRNKLDSDSPVPITFAHIFRKKNVKNNKNTDPNIRVLLDSGASKSVICKNQILNKKCYKDSTTVWKNASGEITSSIKCKLVFNLPEFTNSRLITHKFHVMEEILPGYDMIIGRDLMRLLKLDVKYSTSTLEWFRNGEIPFKPHAVSAKNHFFISDTDNLIAESDRMTAILDAKFSKADLDDVANTTPHLSKTEKNN